MADLRVGTSSSGLAVTMDLLLSSTGLIDETHELASAALIALGSDRRALVDDLTALDGDDLRGWWGDTDANTIWGGWAIGSRLWLLRRAKITDAAYKGGSILSLVEAYIYEAFEPWISAKIATAVNVTALRLNSQTIVANLFIFRGNTAMVNMQYRILWEDI